ncbi:MAG: SMC family ATPase [Chloroflexi bacterium]|nr:SMC family ATPase [Chloroflexota bacterium]
MKLETITLAGFRSYREPVSISFTDGLTAIAGPNGSGKSSIFDALFWALYGVGRGRIDEMVHAGESNMAVSVEFEHGGLHYSVNRGVRWQPNGGSVPSMSFMRGEQDLSGTTIRETQDAVAKVIGTSSVAFSTWYLAQGQAGAFFTAAPAERRQVLGDALGISVEWDALQKLALSVRNGVFQSVETLESDVTRNEGVLSAIEEVPDTQFAAIDAKVQEHEDAVSGWLVERYVLRSDRVDIDDRVASADRVLRDAVEANKAHADWTAQVQATAAQLSDVKRQAYALHNDNVDERIAAAHKLAHTYNTERLTYSARYRAWQTRKSELELEQRRLVDILGWAVRYEELQLALEKAMSGTDVGTCPTCGQDWEGAESHAAEQIAKAQAALDAQHRRAPAGYMTASEADIQLKTVRTMLEQLPGPPEPPVPPNTSEALRDEARVKALDQQLTALTEKTVVLENERPDGQTGDIAALGAALREAEQAADTNTALHRQITGSIQLIEAEQVRLQTDRALLTRQLDRRVDAERSLAANRALLEAERARLGHVETLYMGLSPAGARQLILDTMIPRIEHEANLLLERIAPGTIVEFLTQRDSGIETVEIRVVDGVGYRRVENLSGGEKTRVMFSVRVAMSNVAAASHGLASLPAFIVDETFGDQDEAGRAALLDALIALASEVDQVVAITHDVELLGRIDQVVRLEKIGSSTKVVS